MINRLAHPPVFILRLESRQFVLFTVFSLTLNISHDIVTWLPIFLSELNHAATFRCKSLFPDWVHWGRAKAWGAHQVTRPGNSIQWDLLLFHCVHNSAIGFTWMHVRWNGIWYCILIGSFHKVKLFNEGILKSLDKLLFTPTKGAQY